MKGVTTKSSGAFNTVVISREKPSVMVHAMTNNLSMQQEVEKLLW